MTVPSALCQRSRPSRVMPKRVVMPSALFSFGAMTFRLPRSKRLSRTASHQWVCSSTTVVAGEDEVAGEVEVESCMRRVKKGTGRSWGGGGTSSGKNASSRTASGTSSTGSTCSSCVARLTSESHSDCPEGQCIDPVPASKGSCQFPSSSHTLFMCI